MMLDLKDADLKKTRFYQEVYAEGHEEGREEGRRAEVALVLRLLRRRLGVLISPTEVRIAALTSAELEALGEALLDFSHRSDLDAWLERHGG